MTTDRPVQYKFLSQHIFIGCLKQNKLLNTDS